MHMSTVKRVRIAAIAARAAETNPAMAYVLGVSLALSTSLMSAAWLIPALYL